MAMGEGVICFVEKSIKETKRYDVSLYISKINADGTGYKKLMKRNAKNLKIEGNTLFFLEYYGNALISYDLTDKTEKKICDYAREYDITQDVLYLFVRDEKLIVMNERQKTEYEINQIYKKPFIYNDFVYYIRSESRSDSFIEDDFYYLCRKKFTC